MASLMINLLYPQAITRPIKIITWHRSSTLSVDQKVKSSLKKKLMWIYFIILYFILGKTWNCGKLNIWTWKYLSLKGKFNQVFLLLEFVQFTRVKMRLRLLEITGRTKTYHWSWREYEKNVSLRWDIWDSIEIFGACEQEL